MLSIMMRKLENNNDDIEIPLQILMGSIVALLLLFFMGVGYFSGWALSTIIGQLASVFFITPILMGILKRRMPKELIVVFVIGSIFLFLYKIFFDVTWKDLFIIMGQTFIVWTTISILIRFFYVKAGEKIPP